MTAHDWVSIVSDITTALMATAFVFFLFGGLGFLERRAERKERRRRDELDQHNLTIERAREIINRRMGETDD